MHRIAAPSAVPSTKNRWLVRAALASVLALGGAAGLLACSNQAEGDRCDKAGGNSGNDECQSGLVCTARTSLSANPLTDVCCPANLANSTTQVCGQTVVQQFDAGIPESGPDAADDAADATTEAASDAEADAPVRIDAGADFGIDAASADAPTNG